MTHCWFFHCWHYYGVTTPTEEHPHSGELVARHRFKCCSCQKIQINTAASRTIMKEASLTLQESK